MVNALSQGGKWEKLEKLCGQDNNHPHLKRSHLAFAVTITGEEKSLQLSAGVAQYSEALRVYWLNFLP